MGLFKHGKSACSIPFIKQFLKVRANLRHRNRAYILLSQHSYSPMRARVVAQSVLQYSIDVRVFSELFSNPFKICSLFYGVLITLISFGF